jgi:hypothetical protein
MKVTVVSVRVQKMFSDGNYGHQSAEVSYTAELLDGEDVERATVGLMATATSHVRVELGESETLNIRRAVNPRPHVCNYCEQPLDDWETYSHKACEEQARLERDRRREEERAAQTVGAGLTREDLPF